MLEKENPQMKLLLFCVKAIQRCQKSSKESLFKWEFSSEGLQMHLDEDLNHSGFLWSEMNLKSSSHNLECLSVLEVVKQQK